MFGRIAAVVCWMAGICVLFNIPELSSRDFSDIIDYYAAKKTLRMTFYGIAGGCALFGVMLWELGTCTKLLAKIAWERRAEAKKSRPEIKEPTEFSNR